MNTETKIKPSAEKVLEVLKDGEPHSALEFKRGVHGFYLDAVAQRVSELRRAGHDIENVGKGGRSAVYRLQAGA